MSVDFKAGEQAFLASLVSGAAAGICVDISLFPIDTVKSKLQTPEGFSKLGGYRGLYNGLSAAALGAAPGAALFFCTYDWSKYYLKQLTGPNTPLSLIHLVSSSIGELFACVVRVPTEVVKQKMQTRCAGSSMLDVGRSIVLTDGFAGFYSGFGVTLMREIPFAAIQFPIYEELKVLTAQHIFPNDDMPAVAAAGCGSAAGSLAAAITTPLDVAKTRIMIGTDMEGRKYSGLVDTLKRVYSEGGVKALFAGVQPRVMWISIGGFVFFGAYEFTKSSLTHV